VSSSSALERGTQYGTVAADLIADAIAYYSVGFAVRRDDYFLVPGSPCENAYELMPFNPYH
jgi:hypothetical protein